MTTYTPSLRLALLTPGDPAVKNAWGPPLNTNDTLVESAITGTTTILLNPGQTTFTLNTQNGAPDQARPLIQQFIGGPLSAPCTVTLPNVPKVGWCQNNTSGGQPVILTAGAGQVASIPADGALHFYIADGGTNVATPLVAFLQSNGVFSGGVRASQYTVILNGEGYLLKDVGGFDRPALTCDTFGFTNLINAGGSSRIRFMSQDSSRELFGSDNLGNSYFSGGNLVEISPIISQVNGATWRPQNGWDINTVGAVTTMALGVSGGGVNLMGFFASGNPVGSISTTSGTTSFNTTSDQRLKLDGGAIEGSQAMCLLMGLRPRWFTWRSRPDDDPQPGFFAQQVHRWWPWAVTKGKKRQLWMMDNSKLVPLLTAALQEAFRRIEKLEKAR